MSKTASKIGIETSNWFSIQISNKISLCADYKTFTFQNDYEINVVCAGKGTLNGDFQLVL